MLERIAVSVYQDCEEGEDDMFVTCEPIYVKNGLIYNHPFGQSHIVSFCEDDEPFCPPESVSTEDLTLRKQSTSTKMDLRHQGV